jgi:predicted DNA-binding protein YlxM (UPF0122 family)
MSEIKYFRKCPSCQTDLFYKQKGHRDDAEKKGRVCVKCKSENRKSQDQSLTKLCPSCNKVQTYPTASSQRLAKKQNRLCSSCANQGEYDDDEKTRLTRNCPCCGIIILHTKVYSRRRAEKIKTKCKSCTSKEVSIKTYQPPFSDYNTMFDLFCIQDKSLEEIGLIFNKTRAEVHNNMKKLKIGKHDFKKRLHKENKSICSKCYEIKDISNFTVNEEKEVLNGVKPTCKSCDSKVGRDWYEKNSQITKERAKRHREDNPERHRELSRKKAAKSRLEKPYIHRLRGLLRRFIIATKQDKNLRTTEMLGYDFSDFKAFVDSSLLPLNGNHVDHKCPISWMTDNVPASIANSLDNLQIISENENETKSQWWSHPLTIDFYFQLEKWIKSEYKDRFTLQGEYYVDIRSDYYIK